MSLADTRAAPRPDRGRHPGEASRSGSGLQHPVRESLRAEAAPDRAGADAGTSGADGGGSASAALRGWRGAVRRRTPPGTPMSDAAASGAFERLYRLFIGVRAVLGSLLLATAAAYGVFGIRLEPAGLAVCIVYATLSISLWLLPRFRTTTARRSMARLRSPRWLATIGVDLACFLALYAVAGESGLSPMPLLVLPMLMAGMLTPRLLALATAAGTTLALLGIAWLEVLSGRPTPLLAQAGLAGSGFFVIAVLAGELATRLAREELAARGSLQQAHHQAELSRLVIREMAEGVLVVDRDGRVHAANPAARTLLADDGLAPEAPFALDVLAAWQELAAAVERAFAEAAWPPAGRDLALHFPAGLARTLRVRLRFTRPPDVAEGEAFAVLFLEDLRSVEARTRQERLAAMGRVSAGVAHEIRNPLAAIAQANALLAEDAVGPVQRQLTRMVADNVERLKRIVDDVMAVAPGGSGVPSAIDARAEVEAACSDWARAAGVPAAPVGSGTDDDAAAVSALLQLDLPAEPVGVRFDADHLRRVLVNLLDNARRHASGTPGAVTVRLRVRDARHADLAVASDGAPIGPEVERFLFEPFFSTRSRGTGLGLFICRELCERYGATLGFVRRPGPGRGYNEFTVTLLRAAPADPAAPSPQPPSPPAAAPADPTSPP